MLPRTASHAVSPHRSLFPLTFTIALLGLFLALAARTAFGQGAPSAEARPSASKEEIEIEGVLTVLYEDRDDGSRLHYLLDAGGKRFSLHFAADPPKLHTGSWVRVKGSRIEQPAAREPGSVDPQSEHALALQSGSASVQPLAAALPNTFGAQRAVVLLVNFQDKPIQQPYTVAYANGIFFTTTSNFFSEGSYQHTSLTGDVYGWYTIPLDSTACDYQQIATSAQAAATAAGVNLSAYSRYVYAFPGNACSWWGLGTVGGTPSQAWINGDLQLQVAGHELGHNLGLFHSHALDCGSSSTGPSCTVDEYGDTLDIMGAYSVGHYNAFQKEALGWLDNGVSPPITTVQADGTYWLDPYEAVGANPKALKILKATDPATGKNTWYYIEFRQAVGFDSFLTGNSNVLSGVVVHMGSEASANSSDLLDMTPETSSWSEPALLVGDSFYDPDAGVTIAPVWADSTKAGVTVTFAGLACVPANPTVALSPSQSQWVHAATPVRYTVSVTNNDNAGCGASGFTLQATAPSGWTAAFGASTLSLSPGTRASTTLTITSPGSAADGFYNIAVAATNGATLTATSSGTPTYVASTSATYVIVSSLTVAVSTNKSSYGRNQTVSITVLVTGDGSPAANARVTITVTKPNGTTVTGTVTTGAGGSAVYNYRVDRRGPVGTYQISANANLNNAIFGVGWGSFKVQ